MRGAKTAQVPLSGVALITLRTDHQEQQADSTYTTPTTRRRDASTCLGGARVRTSHLSRLGRARTCGTTDGSGARLATSLLPRSVPVCSVLGSAGGGARLPRSARGPAP